MKILVLSQYYWPENFRINELVESLVEKGVAVDVLTGKPNYPLGKCFPGYRAWGLSQEVVQGVKVFRIPLIPRGTGSLRLALNYVSFVLSGLLFAPWLLRGKSYDAIFIFAPSPILQAIPAVFLGKLKRCPSILWVQDLWPESLSATGYVQNKSILRSVGCVVKFIYRKMSLLLVQSKAFIPRVEALAGRTPVAYYPNSFVEMVPDAASTATHLDLGSGFSVLFAGNIGNAQAVEVIIEAAECLRNEPIKFLVVGDGSRKDWMEEELSRRGLNNVALPGRMPLEAMPALMGSASTLLVTLADKEIFGLTVPSKIQAYLAAGKPIVASVNGAGAELILDAQAGFAVPAEDGKALAAAIKKLYDMPPEQRDALGANGRQYFSQHFSHEKLVDELIRYLQQTITLYQRKIA